MRAWPVILFLSIGGCFPPAPEVSEDADTSASEDTTSGVDIAPDTTSASDSAAGDSATPIDTSSVDTTSIDTTSIDTTSGDTVATVDSVAADTSAPECESDSDCDHLDVPPCVSGSCDDGTCVAQQEIGTCDDGDPCTTEDTCTETGCVGRPWTDEESLGWAALFDGPATDYVTDVAIHPSGDVTVIGSFEATASLAGEARTARGDGTLPDAFIARFTADGTLKWVAQAGGDGVDFAVALVADGEDAVVAGWFQGTATFGTGASEVQVTALPEPGQSFIARYGPFGVPSSVRKYPGAVSDLATVPGATGDLVAVGAFHDTVEFETTSGAAYALTSAGGLDAYLGRFDSWGSARWVSRAGSSGDDRASDIFGGALAVHEDGTVASELFFGATDPTYGAGGSASGFAARSYEATSVVLLLVAGDGGLLTTHELSSAEGMSVVSSMRWTGTSLLRSGLRVEGTTAPTAQLYVERVNPLGGASLWRRALGGGIAYGQLVSTAFAFELGAELVLVGSMFQDLTLDAQADDSPLITTDGIGPRIFAARYGIADGAPVNGVSSPRSGALGGNEFTYRSTLASEGSPEVVLSQVALSTRHLCVTVPSEAGVPYNLLPGPPWLPDQAWSPQGDFGELYCVGARYFLGCPLQ